MRIHLLTKSVLVFCAILPFFCCVTWQAAHAGAIRLPSWQPKNAAGMFFPKFSAQNPLVVRNSRSDGTEAGAPYMPSYIDRNAFRMSFGKRSAPSGEPNFGVANMAQFMDRNSFRMGFGRR